MFLQSRKDDICLPILDCIAPICTTCWLIMWEDSFFLKKKPDFFGQNNQHWKCKKLLSMFAVCFLLYLLQNHCCYNLGGFQWAGSNCLFSTKRSRGHFIQTLTCILVSIFLKRRTFHSQSTWFRCVFFVCVFKKRASKAFYWGLCSLYMWPSVWGCAALHVSALAWMLEWIMCFSYMSLIIT